MRFIGRSYTIVAIGLVSSAFFYPISVRIVKNMGLTDQTVVKIVTAESNMHLQLITAVNGIRMEFLEKDMSKARAIERKFTSQIRAQFKSDDQFQRFIQFRKNFYHKFKAN